MSRGRRLGVALLVVTAVAAPPTAAHLARHVERRVIRTLERAGITAEEVRFHWVGPLRVRHVSAAGPGGARLTADAVDVHWRLLGGRDMRSHVRGVSLRGAVVERSPLTVLWPEATFEILSWKREGGAERLKVRQPGADGGQMEATWPPHGDEPVVAVSRLDLTEMDVRWRQEHVLHPGRWTGRATLARSGPRVDTEGAFHGEAVRLALPHAIDTDRQQGEPTDMTIEWRLCRDSQAVEAERLVARFDGLDLTMRGVLPHEPDRALDVEVTARTELASAFRTIGLPPPLPKVKADTFGRAWLDLSIRGTLADAEELKVENRLRFEATPEVARSLGYLRGPFRHRPHTSPGLVIDVRDGSDFIPIDAVPMLFRRALLISEDAAFSTHTGIDIASIVAAWAENRKEGRVVRGASTITQQLVKNLLLSPERTYGRKIEEAALALMVEAAVPKQRLLEIYVNVIEWGPRLHGLVAAARHYFGKRPEDLTPKEIAFLVCIIPGPVKYHDAHLWGRVGPGMEEMMQTVLGKLLRIGLLTEEEYEAAIYEPLQFTPPCTPG